MQPGPGARCVLRVLQRASGNLEQHQKQSRHQEQTEREHGSNSQRQRSLGAEPGVTATLGQRAHMGRRRKGEGQGVYVNVANGNQVVQARDEQLTGLGPDIAALRTNNQGLLNGDNADNWSSGFYAQQLRVVGTLGRRTRRGARTDRDRAQAQF